jgi:hypothetical protein
VPFSVLSDAVKPSLSDMNFPSPSAFSYGYNTISLRRKYPLITWIRKTGENDDTLVTSTFVNCFFNA